MRLILQKVDYAKLSVNNKLVSKINNGLLVFIGFSKEDNENNFQKIINKIINLRIFMDSNDKMNVSVNDINGDVMLVSQFTLYSKLNGNRPSFSDALEYDKAENLYNIFCKNFENSYKNVKKGVFGAKMIIELVNSGPVTIMFEEKEI